MDVATWTGILGEILATEGSGKPKYIEGTGNCVGVADLTGANAIKLMPPSDENSIGQLSDAMSGRRQIFPVNVEMDSSGVNDDGKKNLANAQRQRLLTLAILYKVVYFNGMPRLSWKHKFIGGTIQVFGSTISIGNQNHGMPRMELSTANAPSFQPELTGYDRIKNEQWK
jgi:hypothetical protein